MPRSKDNTQRLAIVPRPKGMFYVILNDRLQYTEPTLHVARESAGKVVHRQITQNCPINVTEYKSYEEYVDAAAAGKVA